MEMDQEKLAKAQSRTGPPIVLTVNRQDAAILYNLLIDNARHWNAYLREQLEIHVTPTDAFNARAGRQ